MDLKGDGIWREGRQSPGSQGTKSPKLEKRVQSAGHPLNPSHFRGGEVGESCKLRLTREIPSEGGKPNSGKSVVASKEVTCPSLKEEKAWPNQTAN